MSRRLIAMVTLAGGTIASIFVGLAGLTANRVATCGVSIEPQLLARARDAGFPLKRNDLLRFPVVRTVVALPDGGTALEFDLPPNMVDELKGSVRVKDWNECTLDSVATFPGVAAKWDDPFPFVFPGMNTRRCVRRNTLDAGLPCLFRETDGGSRIYSEGTSFPRSDAVDPATCDPVECGVTLGESPEVDL